MNQVGRCMIAGRILAGDPVDRGRQPLPFANAPYLHDSSMKYEVGHGLARIPHGHTPLRPAEHSLIADLSTSLGVKRRDIQHYLYFIAFHSFFDEAVVKEEGLDDPFGLELFVS